MNKTINAFLKLNKYTKVSEVANLSGVLRTNGVLLFDLVPRILLELLDAKRHLALVTVESEDNGLYLIAHLEEVLSAAQVLRPAHLAHVDKTLYSRSNLNECAVVGHNHYFTLNLVANLEVLIQLVPWMWLQLLQAQSDALLLLVKVEDNNVKLLVGLYDIGGVVYATPRQVGDMDKSVNTTQVDKHTIAGDVLNSTLKHLTLLELSDDFLALLLKLGLDECLVRNNNVLVLLVDLNNLELHCLVDKYIIVADGLNVDLATRQEGLDTKDVNDHTTLSAALDVTLNDLVILKRLVNALPALGCACFPVREHELTLLILLVFNKHLNGVAHLKVGVVTELVVRNNTVRLVANVNYYLALVD